MFAPTSLGVTSLDVLREGFSVHPMLAIWAAPGWLQEVSMRISNHVTSQSISRTKKQTRKTKKQPQAQKNSQERHHRATYDDIHGGQLLGKCYNCDSISSILPHPKGGDFGPCDLLDLLPSKEKPGD